MGGKHGRARKHVPLYVAVLIFLAVSACASSGVLVSSHASSEALVAGQQGGSYLQRVQPLMNRADFEGALKESQETHALSPEDPPGDEALFYMGLIYVHYENPKKDYQKALGFFTRVTKEFPRSPRVVEAKIWIGVLEAIEKTKQVDRQIEEKKKEIK